MESQKSGRLGTIKCWSRFVMKELASVHSLFWLAGETISSAERELRDGANAHMAVLVHKRSRACALNDGDPFADNRWPAELQGCLDRWHLAGSTAVARAGAIRMLDRIVAEEQRRLTEGPAAMPMTSRFDTSWAI